VVCLGNNRAPPDADPTDTRFGIVVPHERDGRDIGIRAESPTHRDHIADQGGLLQCRVKEREADARVRHQLEGDLARSLPPELRSTVLMLVFGRSGNRTDPVILLETFFPCNSATSRNVKSERVGAEYCTTFINTTENDFTGHYYLLAQVPLCQREPRSKSPSSSAIFLLIAALTYRQCTHFSISHHLQ